MSTTQKMFVLDLGSNSMMQFETNPLKKYTRPNKQVILQDPQFNNIEIRIFSNFEINNVDSKPMTLDIGPSFKQIFLNFNLLSNSLNIFGASDCIHAFIVAFALPPQYRVVTRYLANSDLHLAYQSCDAMHGILEFSLPIWQATSFSHHKRVLYW